MVLTQRDARKVIAKVYGPDFAFKLTTQCTVGVRPYYQTELGLVTLAWRKLVSGPDSVVNVGRLLSNGAIDWSYDPTQPSVGHVSHATRLAEELDADHVLRTSQIAERPIYRNGTCRIAELIEADIRNAFRAGITLDTYAVY